MEAFNLTGELALITGGGSGLGLGIAERFVEAGARVVLVGRRQEVLQQQAERLGGAVSCEACDITRHERIPGLIERIENRCGPVTILVNNAGNHLKKPAVETTVDEFRSVLDTHVLAAFGLSRAVLPGMIDREQGNILFIASMASFMGVPNVLAYSAAKSAYLGVVRTLSSEVSAHNVRINAIAPGWIAHGMAQKVLDSDPARKQKVLGRTPMNRLGEASDIGYAAVYLCSPAARFVTGVVLPVDGGASIGF